MVLTQYSKEERLLAAKMAAQAAREDLLAFVMLMDSSFSLGPHHRVICDALMDLEGGREDRVMIFLPPRSSKSTISSIYYPAWCLGRHPAWQWLQVSHSDTLAIQFGRSVRDIVYSEQFKALFPGVRIKKDNRAADNWGIEKHNGIFIAAGAGTKIAGRGADNATVDDPVSEQDAFSKAKLDAINEWYPGGLRSRLQPKGRVCIISTRWSEDDLPGHLLQTERENPYSDKWKVVNIPALVTKDTQIVLEQAVLKLRSQGYVRPGYPVPEVGDSFWPEPTIPDGYYWSTKELIRTKHNLPAYQWDALYMQAPTTYEGGILKVQYWQRWTQKLPDFEYKILSLDTAHSAKTSADFSAMTAWGAWQDKDTSRYNLMLIGAEKGRWEFPDLKQKTIDWHRKFRPDIILVEEKASGSSLIQELRMAGYPMFGYNPKDKDKAARAHACTPMFHAGQIHAPTEEDHTTSFKPWAAEVIDECRQFPNGPHDDFVDTTTQAVLFFRTGGWVSHPKDYSVDFEDDQPKVGRPRRYY